MNKSRIKSLLLSMILVFTLSMMGCSNWGVEKTDTSTQNNVEKNSVEEAGDDKLNSDNQNDNRVPNTIVYEYEQELKIIDDNYRNYYEIFVSSFCDSDGDGYGDINGIISKLPYIQEEMGFNGIWLMPVMPSPSYHKYDITDYYSIDPGYGTLEDFKNLIAECDKRGIKLIIDFVFNHTSARHPWFKDAVAYLESLEDGEVPDASECPSVEYYHFTKEYNGSEDYYRAGNSDWYYECVFWDQMPDLALESKALRGEIEMIAKYWLELGVDGFRLDAVKEFYSGETDRNVEVLQWFSDYVATVDEDAYLVGEAWDTEKTIASFYQSGITSFFNFPLAQHNGIIVSSVRKLGTSNAKTFADSVIRLRDSYRQGNPDYIDAPFLSNHDTTRISAQCVNDSNQMKMAAGTLLTMNGSPFVYYGEEIGMNSKGDKDENKRLPMRWSDTDTAGLTNPPAAADMVEQKFASVEEQLQDPLSILNYYRRAIRLRNENPEIARGEISLVEELSGKDTCAIKKTYEGSEIVIIYNMNKETESLDLVPAGYKDLKIRGYLTVDGSAVILDQGVLEMPMYSIVILK